MSEEPQPPAESGRRGPGKRGIPPDQYDVIGRLKCQGQSFRAIGALYGVDQATIRRIWKDDILPPVKFSPSRSLEAELARIDTLEAIAWEKFLSNAPTETREAIRQELLAGGERGQASKEKIELVTKTAIHRNGDVAWLDIVKWCIDARCKLEGHYAAKVVRIESDTGLRVAGQTPDKSQRELIDKIIERIAEVKKREAHLRGDPIIVEGQLLAPPHEANGHTE